MLGGGVGGGGLPLLPLGDDERPMLTLSGRRLPSLRNSVDSAPGEVV